MSQILVPEYREDGRICLNVTPEQFVEITKGLEILYKRREYARDRYGKQKKEEGQEVKYKPRKMTLQISRQ